MAAPLTPAQQEVLDVLRASGEERPVVDGDLRGELRGRLEAELAPLARALTAPVFVHKAALRHVLACEAHHLAVEAEPFAWSAATARGTIAHRAVALSVGRDDDPSPLQLVDEALERLADDDRAGIADWLLGLSVAARAELRADVAGVVGAFRELWPPLQRSWRPDTESRRRVEVAGGMVHLTAKVDLTLGAPSGTTAGRVIVDLKTGASHAGHVDDLRYYALLDTVRVGVPPFALVSYYLDSGQLRRELVTPELLEAAVRRTVDAVRRIVELRLGLRSASVTPNPACAWCPERHGCERAGEWEGADRLS